MSSNSIPDRPSAGISLPDAGKVAAGRPGGNAGDLGVLARGLAILRAFRPRNAPLTNSELAAAVGLPRSTVSRITATLLQMGYLEYVLERAQYRLSPSVLSLGYGSVATSYARQLVEERMQRFAEQNDLLIVLAARDGMFMGCQFVCRGRGALTVRLEAGYRVGLPDGAMGRTWLATRRATEREEVWAEVRATYPGSMSRSELEDAIRQFKRHGYCITLNKMEPDLLGVATLLQLPGELETCVLGCAVPAFRYQAQAAQDALGNRLLQLRDEVVRAMSVIPQGTGD